MQALFAARVLEIQTQNLALAGERLTQVQQLEAGGRAARYDVLRARVERANLEPLALQAASDRDIAAVSTLCAPTIRTAGATGRRNPAMPPASPPPPTGTTTVASSGRSVRISSATVP